MSSEGSLEHLEKEKFSFRKRIQANELEDLQRDEGSIQQEEKKLAG
ncbi:hypothetical protein LPB19_07490 [Marinobacter salinisoli]|uniref:Uncharacterized protein n=1 Tax=Marinobacter salinisoli TaxID=2769486 RepID=A0ABX7MVA1_9GAMM|nr:hypothetical protein [Marinobacter salinisoli]QSP96211.1 hypothetical protein LPB19_07490 [Marinobacter salinisoli]